MSTGRTEPSQRQALSADAGRSCPYCRFALKEGTAVMVCGSCRAPHHLDCWSDNTGCAVLGCAGGPEPGSQARTTPQPAFAIPTAPSATREQTWVAAQPAAVAGQTPTPPVYTPAPPPYTPAPPGAVTNPPNRRRRGSSLVVAIIVLALAILGVAAALVLTKPKSATSSATVTTQPSNVTLKVGQTATFTAAATGTPTPAVQWRRSQDDGTTWHPLSGATSDNLVVPNVTASQNGNEYDAVFANATGSATSNPATLTVNRSTGVAAGPTITSQPANAKLTAGQAATFTAATSGTPTPTVQWRLSRDGGATWEPISGASSDILALSSVGVSEDGNEYDAVFANAAGTATTNAAALSVSPQSSTGITTGQNGSTTTLFQGNDYTISVPAGWTQVSDEVYMDPYFESKWERPGSSGVYILVDHTPGFTGTPYTGSAPLRASVAREPGYTEIAYVPETLPSGPAQRWQFILNGVEKLDVFTVGCQAGFAVLGAAPSTEWSSFASLFGQAAASLEPSSC